MKESQKNDTKEVVINLDTFAIPLAIVIAGVIIALGIFFANRNSAKTDTTDVAGNDTATVDDTGFASGSTDIGGGLVLGNRETAKVAIVEFSDYLCSYCQRHVEQTLDAIITDYVDSGDVIYVFRDFSIHGDLADAMAMAGKYVYAQGGIEKFLEYHSGVFMLADKEAVYSLVESLGFSKSSVQSAVENNTYREAIDSDYSAGQTAGITGTPGFIVGTFDSEGNVTGKIIAGAYPYDSFKTVIDSMLNE